MPQPIRLTFDNLTRMANSLGDDANIIVKNNGFLSQGKVGSFFTLKSTHRRAGEVLYAAVRQRYGETIADALAPQMRATRDAGKPLSARTVRDILASAAEMSDGIRRINEDMARHFVFGNTGKGDRRNLDAAFNDFCTQKGIDPASYQQLKGRFGEIVLAMAENQTQTILSYEEMSTMVRTAGTPAMQKLVNAALAQAFLDDPVHGADAAVDAYATRMAFDAAQKTQLHKLVRMAVFYEAEVAVEKGVNFSKESLFQSVSNGTMSALKGFSFACGKAEKVDATIEDTVSWSTPQTLADLSMLGIRLGAGGGIAVCSLAVQRLDVMRNLQPEGMLTRETIWQGCFNEPMPQNLKDATEMAYGNALFDHLATLFRQIQPDSASAAEDGMIRLSTGLSLEKTIESLRGPISLTQDDFLNLPHLTPLARLGTLQDVETSIAIDLHRRGVKNTLDAGQDDAESILPGYMPTISFGTVGGEVETVSIRDTTGMSDEDKARLKSGTPSSRSHDLVQRAMKLCGNNEVQARQVILSMGQSGAFLVRSTGFVTGIFETEHTALDIDIRREANGNITMRYYTPAQSPLDMDYTFTVTPDGLGTLTAYHVQARQQAGGPEAAVPADE